MAVRLPLIRRQCPFYPASTISRIYVASKQPRAIKNPSFQYQLELPGARASLVDVNCAAP